MTKMHLGALIFASTLILGTASALAGNTTAYFFHRTAPAVVYEPYALEIDRKRVTRLNHRQYSKNKVPSGKREARIVVGEGVLCCVYYKFQIDLRPGKTQYFMFGFGPFVPVIGRRPFLKEISAKEAKQLMAEFQRIN